MTLEEEQSKVYETIGRGISTWGGLEMALAMTFSVLVAQNYTQPHALVVFFSIESFRSKLNVIDSVFLDPSINKDMKKEWKKVHNQIKSRQTNRNRFAHHDIMINEGAEEFKRVTVVPPQFNPNKQLPESKMREIRMNLKDLQNAVSEFSAVTREVLSLNDRLMTPAPSRKK